MNILHFSKSDSAGAPIRLVQALQRFSDYKVHIVDLKRWNVYEHDIIYKENPERVFELAEKADIIHLHNHLDCDSKDFYPVDFYDLLRKGKLFVRHFHGIPSQMAKYMGKSVSDILDNPIPSLVIAQWPERYYPKAMVVPNILPQNDASYLPSLDPETHDIFFSPGGLSSAWGMRWGTKGAPETLSIMKRVSRLTGCKIKLMTNRPFAEVLREKRKAKLVIDELITGSYHLNALEGLCLGKPTLCFIDNRVEKALKFISGSSTCPFINVRLEDAFETLIYLLEHQNECSHIGQAGRQWIERYWADHILVKHFVEVYEKLSINPDLVTRQKELSINEPIQQFFEISLPDIIYQARENRYYEGLSIFGKIRVKSKPLLITVKRLPVGIARLGHHAVGLLPDVFAKPIRILWSKMHPSWND